MELMYGRLTVERSPPAVTITMVAASGRRGGTTATVLLPGRLRSTLWTAESLPARVISGGGSRRDLLSGGGGSRRDLLSSSRSVSGGPPRKPSDPTTGTAEGSPAPRVRSFGSFRVTAAAAAAGPGDLAGGLVLTPGMTPGFAAATSAAVAAMSGVGGGGGGGPGGGGGGGGSEGGGALMPRKPSFYIHGGATPVVSIATSARVGARRARGVRILFVDDLSVNRRMGVRTLELLGCVADTAEDGTEVGQRARHLVTKPWVGMI